MSKQPKQVKSTPEIYQGITQRPGYQNICIVEDLEGNFSLHNSVAALEKLQSFSALIKDTLSKVWGGFDAFCAQNKQTILAYHEQIFKAEPPKDQDITITSLYIWNKIIMTAKTDMTTAIPTTASGRTSTISTRKYMYGKNEDEAHTFTGTLKTPQALACLRLFRAAIVEKGNKEPIYIDEGTLKQYVIDHASDLKTRQDPWRIFQYYRPSIIAEGLLKHD